MPPTPLNSILTYIGENQAEVKKIALLVFGFVGVVGIALALFVTMEPWTLLLSAVGVGGVLGVHFATQSPDSTDL
ncbi:hypothetical protein [Prescottella subtropica]|uniref:hypothetical protein n=1 Tax=Prescottella subtropica TaxID=2545757 RepID=UPI0010F84193|nr:hypothetical protein [Prescottella subtropica]